MHSNKSRVNHEEEQILQDVIAALRTLMKQTNTLVAPIETLKTLDLKLSQCIDFIQSSVTGNRRAMAYYNPDVGQKIDRMQPYSPFIGHYNPLAPPLDCWLEGNKAIGEVVLNELYEGPPNSCHGGVISGIYDQLLAMASIPLGKSGPTAYLHITYKGFTPLYKKIRFETWIDRIEGKKIYAKGCCYHEDTLLTEADALFIDLLL